MQKHNTDIHLLIVLLGLPLSSYSRHDDHYSDKYAVIFDAGSSGSRVHVFRFNPNMELLNIGNDIEFYLAVALNYLYGNLGKNYPGTVATIDLGGGSVQIAYAVSKQSALTAPKLPNGDPYVQQQLLLGKNYYLYVHSFLNYGLLAARAEILKASKNSTSPCIVEGHNGYYTYNGVAYKAEAQKHGPRIRRCKAIIRKVLQLDAPCNHKNCSFAGVWNGGGGAGTKNLHISSFFYDFASVVGIVDPTKPSGIVEPIQYYKAAKLACQTKKQNVKSVFPNIEDQDIPYICMDLMYEYTLLVHGFGIGPYRKITVVHQVNYKDHLVGAAWPLGSAIDAVS